MKDSPESLKELAERVFEKLASEGLQFALAGGLLADVYRGEPRGTGDIDVVVSLEASSVRDAERIIKELGFRSTIVTEAALRGDTRFKRAAKRSAAQIIVGRNETHLFGVDFILLSIPWAKRALERAQVHRIDFGLREKVPSLTVEDLLISKMFAVKNNSSRRIKKFDIPDIAAILEEHGDVLDVDYLGDVMTELLLAFPKSVEEIAPYRLARIGRKLRRRNGVVFDY